MNSFLTDNRNVARLFQAPFWLHAKGLYCFQLDASVSPPTAPSNGYFY